MDRWDVNLRDPEVFEDMSVPGLVGVHKDEENLSNQMKPVGLGRKSRRETEIGSGICYGGREAVGKAWGGGTNGIQIAGLRSRCLRRSEGSFPSGGAPLHPSAQTGIGP